MMKWLIACFLSVSMVNMGHAQSAQEKGLAIAQNIERQDRGWGDATTKMKMILRNRQGQESTRAIKIKILEMKSDGDKTLIIFDSPRDLKGTAFLTFSHAVKADDQWLFLPALKRVKRISSANKSGPFMGSQFAYEDIVSFEVDKFRYKYLRDEKLGAHQAFVVETYPQYKYSGYTRQVVWVDKQRHIPLQIKYYDRKNDLLKTLKFINYKQYLNKYWRTEKQVMENHQNGSITTLIWSEYRFRNNLANSDFDRNSLKRAR